MLCDQSVDACTRPSYKNTVESCSLPPLGGRGHCSSLRRSCIQLTDPKPHLHLIFAQWDFRLIHNSHTCELQVTWLSEWAFFPQPLGGKNTPVESKMNPLEQDVWEERTQESWRPHRHLSHWETESRSAKYLFLGRCFETGWRARLCQTSNRLHIF